MQNINTTYVKTVKIQVCYTNRNIIMNFVGNDGESEPWKRTAEGTTSDSLVDKTYVRIIH